MKAGGTEVLGQSYYLLGTRHDTEFTSFASFLVNFDSWHMDSLLGSSRNQDELRALKAKSPKASYKFTQLLNQKQENLLLFSQSPAGGKAEVRFCA
jgi:hypothetical protein